MKVSLQNTTRPLKAISNQILAVEAIISLSIKYPDLFDIFQGCKFTNVIKELQQQLAATSETTASRDEFKRLDEQSKLALQAVSDADINSAAKQLLRSIRPSNLAYVDGTPFATLLNRSRQ